MDPLQKCIFISSAFQAAWEKVRLFMEFQIICYTTIFESSYFVNTQLFRYFDIEAKIAKPNLVDDKMAVDAKELAALCDEKTIAVVGILG